MKKLFFMFSLLLLSVAVFCQVDDGGLKDALINLGLNPAYALVASVLILTVIGQLIPQKWSSVLLYVEKVFYALYIALHKLNEKFNNLSKSQKAAKVLKKAAGVLMLLLLVGVANAQEPFSGFFKPADQVVKSAAVRAGQPADASYSTWLFRPSATLTAVAIDFREKPALAKSFTSFGFGVSYGKFTTVNDNAYCNYSFNGLFLTSVKIGDVQSTSVGGAITVDVFNKLIGFGVGYLDKGFMLLTTISYSF